MFRLLVLSIDSRVHNCEYVARHLLTEYDRPWKEES